MMRHLLITITTMLVSLSNIYAVKVTGYVTDKDKNPIPYTLVKGDSTTFGVITNEQGYYELEMVPGRYTLIAEITGFKSVSKPIELSDVDIKVDFQLLEQQYNLGTVYVTNTGEDPAYGIMRSVLAHKKTRKLLIRSLETDIYLKGVLSLDGVPEKMLGKRISDTAKAEMGVDKAGRGIVYLLEQKSKYKFIKPNLQKTEILSVRQAGDPQGLGFATLPPIIDFYDNIIFVITEVNDRGFISPIHDNAFMYYKYKLAGSYEDHGNTIFKIDITPKRLHEPCFVGSIYIVDRDFELKAVDLLATKNQGINILDTLSFRQSYKMMKNTRNWIVENQTIIPYLNFFGFKVTGSFLTSYSNQKLNEYIDPQIFKGDVISTYSKEAWDKKDTYWDSIRSVPLTDKEVKSYNHIDSMSKTYTQRADSIKNKFKPLLGITDFIVGGPGFSKGNVTFRINNLLDIYNFNSVEGHNITVKPTLIYRTDKYNSWQATYNARYGFSSKKYYQRASLNYFHKRPHRPDRTHNFRISGGNYIQEYTGLWNVSELFNSAMTLIYGQNLLHFYERKYLTTRYDYTNGSGLRVGITLMNEERFPLTNNTDYTWASNNNKRIMPNHPATIFDFVQHKAATIQLRAFYQPGWKYIDYPTYRSAVQSNAPEYYFIYTKGIPNIFNSIVDFDKWSLGTEHKMSMGLLGRFDYHLNVGGFFNKKYVGIPDLHHFKSSEILLENQYLQSFQMAPYFRLSNESPLYGRAHLEWHLFGLLTNKIPLFNKLDWHLVFATNSIIFNKEDYYSEVSIGLENIGFKMFRFLRASYIMSIDSKKNNAKPEFGFRIGVDSKILSNAISAFD